MFGTVARNASRKNFAAFGGEATEFCRVFVVNVFNFIDAEGANFSSRASTSFSAHVNPPQVDSKRRVFGIDWLAAESVIVSFGRSGVAFAVRFAGFGIAVVGGF